MNNVKVILLGTSEYIDDNIHNIPNVLASITALKEVFSANLGIPKENIFEFINLESSDSIRFLIYQKLKSFVKTDTLIFYYIGHGFINSHKNDYYWAHKNSILELIHDNGLTGIPVQNLISDIKSSKPKEKILIIDACRSGAALNTMGGHIKEVVHTKLDTSLGKKLDGIFAMAAVGEDDFALFPKNEPNSPTYFTQAFLKTIKSNATLTLDQLYSEIFDELTNSGKPLPKKLTKDTIGEFQIKNKIYIPPTTKNILKVVVLAATHEEMRAVYPNLDNYTHLGSGIFKGIYKTGDVEIAEITTRVTGINSFNAAQSTLEMIYSFGKDYFDAIFYSGVAIASKGEKKFILGDVIYADTAFNSQEKLHCRNPLSYYDFNNDKIVGNGTEYKFNNFIDSKLDFQSNFLSNYFKYSEKFHFKSKLKIIKETIYSSDDLIKKCRTHQMIGEQNPAIFFDTKSQIFDQEGYGFLKAILNSRFPINEKPIGLIRGIAVVANGENSTQNDNTDNDFLFSMAAQKAAQCMYYLIYQIYIKNIAYKL